ncbi:MAG: hypothetical protein WC009_11470 [Methylotenera sp.]
MKPKFELPESIFSVTKSFPNKPRQINPIPQIKLIPTNKSTPEQLSFFNRVLASYYSDAQRYLRIAKWTLFIAVCAIILSAAQFSAAQ